MGKQDVAGSDVPLLEDQDITGYYSFSEKLYPLSFWVTYSSLVVD
jgi:hypothetical protein